MFCASGMASKKESERGSNRSTKPNAIGSAHWANSPIQAIAVLNNLPTEIYQIVLTLLPPKDLSALSLTSKGHRSLVEPILYRRIRWKQGSFEGRQPPAHLLLRSPLDRSELASYVICLGLECRKPFEDSSRRWTDKNNDDLDTTDLKRMESLIESLSFPTSQGWKSSLMEGGIDLFLALLIS